MRRFSTGDRGHMSRHGDLPWQAALTGSLDRQTAWHWHVSWHFCSSALRNELGWKIPWYVGKLSPRAFECTYLHDGQLSATLLAVVACWTSLQRALHGTKITISRWLQRCPLKYKHIRRSIDVPGVYVRVDYSYTYVFKTESLYGLFYWSSPNHFS